MSTTETLCTCGRPTGGDRFLCGDCSDAYAEALGQVPGVVDELDVTLAKQQRFVESLAVSASSNGLPYDVAASTVLHELRAELVSLVRLCQAEQVRSSDYRDREPVNTSASMSRWLLWRVDGLAGMPWAADALSVVRIVARAELVIDRPADRTYAGPCDDCGRDLYVELGHLTVVCEHCGVSYDLKARRDWLLQIVHDRLAPAAEIARALSSLELPVSHELIRQWKHRGRLHPRAHDRAGAPLYRVGDVVDLLAAQRSRALP